MISELIRLGAQQPLFFSFVAAIIGACIGSFLNVIISRTPHGLSIVSPGSHCDCGKPIAWYDNIPVISWLILRGRGRCCGQPIGLRHPFIECFTAFWFVYLWRHLSPDQAFCGWIFASALIAASFIDLEHMIIPDFLSLGLGVLGVVLSGLVPSLHNQHSGLFILDSIRSIESSLIGVLIGSGLLFWIAMLSSAVLKKEAMGLGDVKFIGAIGAFCGWRGILVSIFGGALLGVIIISLIFLFKLCFNKKNSDTSSLSHPIPFGPMLALAGLLYFACLHTPIDRYLATWSDLF